MMLLWLIIVLIAGGLLAWLAARWSALLSRCISLAAVLIDLAITLYLLVQGFGGVGMNSWFEQLDWSWIPELGIHFHLAMDGLSLLLTLLACFLGLVAIIISWRSVPKALGFYHLNLLWILAGIIGVFLSLDLFLFYFSWELMLIPMYFLIAIWGRERRAYASIKFFLFTQLSGLFMLIAILALYFAHHQATGVYTFEYLDLLGTPLSAHGAMWIMVGFFIAFAVKLPVFPFHTWLPDACAEATTATNVILAGLLPTTAAYGMIRFLYPLFPNATRSFAPVAVTLAVITILYGAILAFSQTNLMRLLAYASISHLGFVLLGIFSGTTIALEGVAMTLIAHGLSTSALFIIAGAIEDRMGTRDIEAMGGLWDTIPRLSGAGLFFALASLGLPGLGDFIGEFLILLGTFHVYMIATIIAACGVLAATFYALRFVQRAFQGPKLPDLQLPDIAAREALTLGVMIALLLWLGFYPQPVFHAFSQAANHLPALWR